MNTALHSASGSEEPATGSTRTARMPRYSFVWLAAIVLAILWLPSLLHLRSQAGHLQAPTSRRAMIPIAVPQLDGATWTLASHRGQVVLVNFWATWCGPCREELPGLVDIARRNPAKVAIVGISLDSADDQLIRDFATRHRITYPIARADPTWQLDQIPTGVPTTILIDTAGRIAKSYSGAIREKDFQADIDELLREPATPASPPSAPHSAT